MSIVHQNNKTLFVGGSGTGKTTQILNIIKIYENVFGAHPYINKVIIFDIQCNPHFQNIPRIGIDKINADLKKGVYKFYTTDIQAAFKAIENARNALIVLEDCSMYVPRDVCPDYISRLILTSKQPMQCDILFTFHSWKTCNDFIIDNSTHYGVFKTGENIKDLRRLPNFLKSHCINIENSPSRYAHKVVANSIF